MTSQVFPNLHLGHNQMGKMVNIVLFFVLEGWINYKSAFRLPDDFEILKTKNKK
jgi:hypothetical protein